MVFTVSAWSVFTVFTASAFMYFVFSAFVEGRNVLQNTALPGLAVGTAARSSLQAVAVDVATWRLQAVCAPRRRGVDVAATRLTPGSA